MAKILTTEQMRAVEISANKAGISYEAMMIRAGAAVAEAALAWLGGPTIGKKVVALIGKGNNGGDGLVAARLLKQSAQADVTCFLMSERDKDDPMLVAATGAGVSVINFNSDTGSETLSDAIKSADMIIDALLGTGARPPVRGSVGDALRIIGGALQDSAATQRSQPLDWVSSPRQSARRQAVVIAVDCPSGLDCDNGAIDEFAIRADATVTFAGAKRGHVLFPGAEACGELAIADIGIPPDLPELKSVELELVSAREAAKLLPLRRRNSHKGGHGRITIVAGSRRYIGAAVLAGKAAYRIGVGLAELATPESIYSAVAAGFAEAIWLPLPEVSGGVARSAVALAQAALRSSDAWIVGPGLGRSADTEEFVRDLVAAPYSESTSTLPDSRGGVIDADGLNALAQIDEWWKRLPRGIVITPHVGEMARLCGVDSSEVTGRRLELAGEKAALWNCVVVLKGAFTAIGAPDGRVAVLPFATDSLAKAGTGDALAGCIGGLLAQGCRPFEAAVLGAYVHGLAGTLVGKGFSSRSVTASEVIDCIPEALAILETWRPASSPTSQ